MRKKYIFLDLDGTIIDHKNKGIPLSTRETIKKLQDNGHEIIISTGRVPAIFYGVEKELNVDSYIAANGGIVVLHGKMIVNKFIDKQIVSKLIEIAYENKIDVAFEGINDYVLNSQFSDLSNKFSDVFHLEYPKLHHNFHLKNDIYQMVMFYMNSDYKKFEKMFPTLSFHYSNKYGLDVNEKGGMKELGVKAIVKELNINIEDTIAVGDGANDISMIEYTNLGVAMGNACEPLKQVADVITDSVDNDGLYNLFKKLKMI